MDFKVRESLVWYPNLICVLVLFLVYEDSRLEQRVGDGEMDACLELDGVIVLVFH